MTFFKKLNQSKILFWCLCIGIFGILLACNFLTGMCVDDYGYSFSYSTGARITSVLDIFPSIGEHYKVMNGRSITHFLVQLFLFLPHPIFKFVNAGMFLLQILLIYSICKEPNSRNNLVLATIFGLIWAFEPVFGQVNLWQDGACNYLWSIIFGLAFLIPLIQCFLHRETCGKMWQKILYVVLGFAAGGYLENLSATVIFMAFVLLLLIRFYHKEKVPLHFILALAAAAVAFVIMVTAPGEMKNKIVKKGWSFFRENFMAALDRYQSFWLLALVFLVLFVFAVFLKTNREKLIVSALFALGSLCANFIFVVASYYPARASACSALLLITADAILMAELFSTKFCAAVTSFALVMLLVTFYDGCLGMNDIYKTHLAMNANIATVQQCKAEGKLDVTVPMVNPSTKYSAINYLKYLDKKDATSWPNASVAKYYGVHSVLGK